MMMKKTVMGRGDGGREEGRREGGKGGKGKVRDNRTYTVHHLMVV